MELATWSLIASIVSIIIGVVAVGLAIFFFKMSTSVAESTKEAAKNISFGVEYLKNLFGTL